MWVDNEDENNPANQTNGTPSAPSVGAGGGTAQAGGTTSNPSTQTPVQPSQPQQNFATVQDYFGANKAQGDTLGQNFSSKLGQSASNERSAIDTAANQTNNDISAGTVNYDPNIVSTAVSDPTKVTGNPDQLQSFLKQWNAAYTGPQSFETSAGYTPAATASNEAKTNQQELATTGGQQQLLQDQYGVYGQGNKGLDQALLQNSSSYPTIQNQGKDFGTVQDYFGQKSQDLDTAATTAAANTDATKAQTQNAFANNLSNFQAGLNTKVSAAQTQATTDATKFQQDLKNGDTATVIADIKKANPNADTSTIQQYLDAYTKDYGSRPDLSSQYKFNPNTDINAANVANAQDYANAAAYGKLTGVDYSGVLNPADASKAGTAPAATTGVNPNIADYLKTQYANAELQKFGAPILSPTSPNAPNPAPKDVAGTVSGGTVGSAVGNVVGGPLSAVIGGSLGATLGGKSGLSNSINKAVGIGAGSASKDATVNLPALNLPPLSMPANANPAGLKTVIDTFNQPLSTTGSYHEGALYDMASRLQNLKDTMTSGQITPAEYASYSKPLIAWATQAAQSIMGASSAAANSAKPAWNQIQSFISPTK